MVHLRPVMTRPEFALLKDLLEVDGDANILVDNGIATPKRGILQSIQRESGNGRCFNIGVTVGFKPHSVYVRVQG